MPSKRWRDLESQLENLRARFLPRPFDALGNYADPPQVQAQSRAFLVLCHAELEAFLEESAREVAGMAAELWSKKKRVSRPMACMLCVLAERVKLPKPPVGASTDDMAQRLEIAVQRTVTAYYTSVNDNHGIKEKNVWTLFGPLGIPNTVLAGTLLPDLESYGRRRGVHAHQSVAQAVVSVLDPETEFNRVKQIAELLKPLDSWVSEQKRKLR